MLVCSRGMAGLLRAPARGSASLASGHKEARGLGLAEGQLGGRGHSMTLTCRTPREPAVPWP